MRVLPAFFLLCALPTASLAVQVAVPQAGPTRSDVRRVLTAQLQIFETRPPADALGVIKTLAGLPQAGLHGVAADRAAAQAALAVIAAPDFERLKEDRQARVPYARALGAENVARLVDAAAALRAHAVLDPSLGAQLTRLTSQGPGLEAAYARLDALFDRGRIPGFEDFRAPSEPGQSGLIIPSRRGRIERAPAEEPPGLVIPRPEDAGLLIETAGRREKLYPQDGLIFERRSIPGPLAPYYEELPGGAIRRKARDPLADQLAAAGVELWSMRHGQSETNRAGIFAGAGADPALTTSPDEHGLSGKAQGAAAALTLYHKFGGDAWARRVLAGVEKPAILLTSPLKRARQTTALFARLLDERARRLGGPAARPLYRLGVERNLAEMSFGSLEKRRFEDVRALAFFKNFDSGDGGAGRTFLDRFPGGGDSRMDMMIRQHRVLRRVLKDYAGRRVVLIGHHESVSSQRAVLGMLETRPEDGALKAAHVPNAAPEQLVFPGAKPLSFSN